MSSNAPIVIVRNDSRAWRKQVWISVAVAVALCAVDLARMDIDPTYQAHLLVSWLILIWSAFTLATTLRDAHEAGLADARAQARLRLRGWRGGKPAPLHIDPLTRLGGRLTRAHIAFDDHPNATRCSRRIEAVTADPVFAWLRYRGVGEAPVVIR